MAYVLGIDVGSSATKVGLFSIEGREAGVASRCYPTHEPLPAYREQEPERWWKATVEGIHEVLRLVEPSAVIAIGATGYISSLTFVDAAGKPLRPAVGFQDLRAVREVEELYSHFTRRELAALLGIDLPPAATWTLPRLLWFQKYEPRTLECAHCLLQAKDFINLRLTGEFASDASSNRGIVDFSTNLLARPVFERLRLPERLLPRICGPHDVMGTLSRTAAKETGLPQGLPVVTGWNDLNAAVVGSGVVNQGGVFNITGASEHIGVVTSDDRSIPELISAPFLPGKRLLYGVTSCGGGSLEWYRSTCHQELPELLSLAESVREGSDWLLFLPYLQGERAPIWDPRASGAFIGIRSLHGQGHLVRAILEGVAFSLREIFELVERSATINSAPLVISGGAARIRLWNQIKADVLGRPATVPASVHAGALGAAMLAAVATGMYSTCEAAARAMVKFTEAIPVRDECAAQYGQIYRRFCELYPALKACFARIEKDRINARNGHVA